MLDPTDVHRCPCLYLYDLLEGFGEGCLLWCQLHQDLELRELAHREPYKLPREQYVHNIIQYIQSNFTWEN